MAVKSILVEFGSHSRVVFFEDGADLTKKVDAAFQDVFATPPAPYFLKLFSQDWNRYVDIRPEQTIPDKGVVQIVLKESLVSMMILYFVYQL